MQAQAQLFGFRRPVKHAEPLTANAVEHRLMQLLFRGLRQRLGLDHQLADHRPPPGLQRPLRLIPFDGIGTLRQPGALRQQRIDVQRQRQQNPRVRRGASLQEQRRNQPFVAPERIVGVQHRPHPVGELIAPFLTAATGNPVDKCRCQQRRQALRIRLTIAAAQSLQKLLRPLLPVRLLAGKRRAEIAVSAARRLFEDRRQFRRGRRIIRINCRCQHGREPRVITQGGHFAPARR